MKILMNTNQNNSKRGIFQIKIPDWEKPKSGKVRDNWIFSSATQNYRMMITTDRQSVDARYVATVPQKGMVSNLISEFWFNLTKDIVGNHLISVPHPNVLLAKQAKLVFPIEIIIRRYLAKGNTPTSICYNYFTLQRRNIYGIDFPNSLQIDDELPMGNIITPTTKAKDGHDEELSQKQAEKIVDKLSQAGTWDKIKKASEQIFERARLHCLDKGIILADTKFEFGIDEDGELMIIDELLTPECSRYWYADSYLQLKKEKKNQLPNKDALVDWLEKNNEWQKGEIPNIDPTIVDQMTAVSVDLFTRITGQDLKYTKADTEKIKNIAMECKWSVLIPDRCVKYLSGLSNEKAQRIVKISSWNKLGNKISDTIIQKIKSVIPNIPLQLMGSQVLKISGQRDLDITGTTNSDSFVKYKQLLEPIFGKVTSMNNSSIVWHFHESGYEVAIYIVDPSKSDQFERQKQTNEILLKNPDLLKEYEQLKLSLNGKTYLKYQEEKFKFFHKIDSLRG